MPLYDYEGNLYDLEETDASKALARIEEHLGKQKKPVVTQPEVSTWDELPQAALQGFQKAVASVGRVGADISNRISPLDDLEGYKKDVNTNLGLDKHKQMQTFGGKLTETAANVLPFALNIPGAAVGLSTVYNDTVDKLIKEGVPLDQARNAAEANVGMMIVAGGGAGKVVGSMLGKTVGGMAGFGVGAEAGRLAENEILYNQPNAQTKFDPEQAIINSLVGGVGAHIVPDKYTGQDKLKPKGEQSQPEINPEYKEAGINDAQIRVDTLGNEITNKQTLIKRLQENIEELESKVTDDPNKSPEQNLEANLKKQQKIKEMTDTIEIVSEEILQASIAKRKLETYIDQRLQDPSMMEVGKESTDPKTDNAVMANIMEDNPKRALEAIAEHSNDSHLRQLARRVLDNPIFSAFIKTAIQRVKEGSAWYDRVKNEIGFNGFRNATAINLIHEVLHQATSATLHAIQNGGKVGFNLIKPGKEIVSLYDKLYQQREAIRSKVSEEIKPLIDHMFKNATEFVSYGLTVPEIRKALDSIPAPGQFWKLTANFFSKLIGKKPYEVESMLESLHRNTNTLIDETQGLGKKDYGIIDPGKIDSNVDLARNPKTSDIGWKNTGQSLSDFIKNLPANITKHAFTQTIPQIWRDNPVIQRTNQVISDANRRAAANFHKVFGGTPTNPLKVGTKFFFRLKKIQEADGLGAALLKVPYTDLVDVYDVLRMGYRDRIADVNDLIARHGNHLSDSSKDVLRAIQKASDKMYDIANSSLMSRGLKGIGKAIGYFPVHRIGNHFATVKINGVSVRYEGFISRKEAENFKSLYERTNRGSVVDIITKGENTSFDSIIDALEHVRDELQKNPSLSKTNISTVFNNTIERLNNNTNNIGGHAQQRSGLVGYVGSEIGMSKNEKGKRIAKALEAWVREYTDAIRRREIEHDILDSRYSGGYDAWKSMPNATAIAEHMINSQTNKIHTLGNDGTKPSYVHEAFNNAYTTMFPNSRLSTPVLSKINGKLTHLFYVFRLTGRLSIIASQYFSSLNAMRSLFRVDNTTSLQAYASIGETFAKLFTGQLTKDPEFVKAINWTRENSNDLFPQLTNELNDLSVHRNPDHIVNTLIKTLTGEVFTAAGDSSSRFITYAMAFTHLKKAGLRGTALYKAAGDIANNNQFQYGKSYQPTMYKKLGVIGEMMTPLKTFAHGQAGNIISDIKYLIQSGNVNRAKAMNAVALSGLMFLLQGGVISAPILAEYEILRRFGLSRGWWGEEWPSLTEWALKQPEYVSHGVLSAATGVDMGASMRYTSLVQGLADAELGILNLLPTLKFASDYASAAASKISGMLTNKTTPEEKYENAKALTPSGWLWGTVDQLEYNSTTRPFTTNNKGDAIVPQTGTEVAASYIGSQSVKESKEKAIKREMKSKEDVRTRNINRGRDLILSDDDSKIELGVQILIKEGVPPNEIKQMLLTKVDRKYRPSLDRTYSNRKGEVKSYNQARKLNEIYDMLENNR